MHDVFFWECDEVVIEADDSMARNDQTGTVESAGAETHAGLLQQLPDISIAAGAELCSGSSWLGTRC